MDVRSHAQFRTGARRSLCEFGPDKGTIIVVTEAGQYLKASIPEGGGECERLAYAPCVKAARA